MLVPPTTLRYDTWGAVFAPEHANYFYTHPTPVVVSADLVVQNVCKVAAAIILGIGLIEVLTVKEYQDAQSAAHNTASPG